MNSICWSIDSIKLKFCLKTNDDILKEFKLCKVYSNVPLPNYRYHKDQSSVYCYSCFISSNFEIENMIFPSNLELKFLNLIVFNCKNFESGCKEMFDCLTLNDMVLHHKQCKKGNLIPKNCKRCGEVLTKDKFHDCYCELKKNFNDNESNYFEIFNKVEGKFHKQNKKISQLELIISNQNKIINDLSKLVKNLQKNTEMEDSDNKKGSINKPINCNRSEFSKGKT